MEHQISSEAAKLSLVGKHGHAIDVSTSSPASHEMLKILLLAFLLYCKLL